MVLVLLFKLLSDDDQLEDLADKLNALPMAPNTRIHVFQPDNNLTDMFIICMPERSSQKFPAVSVISTDEHAPFDDVFRSICNLHILLKRRPSRISVDNAKFKQFLEILLGGVVHDTTTTQVDLLLPEKQQKEVVTLEDGSKKHLSKILDEITSALPPIGNKKRAQIKIDPHTQMPVIVDDSLSREKQEKHE